MIRILPGALVAASLVPPGPPMGLAASPPRTVIDAALPWEGISAGSDLRNNLRVPAERLPSGCRLAPFGEGWRSPFLPLTSNPGLITDPAALDFMGAFLTPVARAREIEIGYAGIYQQGDRGSETGVYAVRLKPGINEQLRKGPPGRGPGPPVLVKGRVAIIVWTDAQTTECRDAIYDYLASRSF